MRTFSDAVFQLSRMDGPEEPRTLYRFLFLLEGEIHIEAGGQPYRCAAGQFLLVPEGMSLSLLEGYEAVGYRGAFSIPFLKDASYPVLHGGNPVHQTFWFEDGAFLGALLERMLTADADGDKALLRSGLDLILGQLKPVTPASALPERFLNRVFDRKPPLLSITEYAEELGVTPNYLNKSVKSFTRRTAIEWVELSRLEHAKQLLRDRSLSIIDVAVGVGLDDPSYFARFFKKKTGMAPTTWRANLEKV